MRGIVHLIVCGVLILGCFSESTDGWETPMPDIGSHSSPQLADITGDGFLDIILGAGQNEFQPSKHGVFALDGLSGDTLWTHPCIDQMYGSAVFLDINRDRTPDALMVGRDKQLYAIDASTGQDIWSYELTSNEYDPLGLTRFNFYNPLLLEDLDADGVEDFMIVNGGNVNAIPGDTINRHPGVLLVMSSASGDIIVADTMPDGKESYMTPAIYRDDIGASHILFGTGGESVTGTLYTVPFDSLIGGSIQSAEAIYSIDNGHGFIAPPIVSDFTNDGYDDFVILDHGGEVILFDGQDRTQLWQVILCDIELNAQASPGYFNDDDILDLFINGARGTWPKNTGSYQFFVDGASGQIIKEFNVGCAGFASAVSIPSSENSQLSAVLLPVNEYDCRRNNTFYTTTWLQYFSIDTSYQLLATLEAGKNISSTPWVGDIDDDQQMDIIYVVNTNVRLIQEFLGMKVKRLETDISWTSEKYWDSYLGPKTNSRFDFQKSSFDE